MSPAERRRFDALLEAVLAALPGRLHELLEEAPLIVDDRPDADLARELDLEHTDELCGLHTGTPLTERSIEDVPSVPDVIHLFREGILVTAGGWRAGKAAIAEEIRVTVLHEVGHHFGLEEEDLEELGYD